MDHFWHRQSANPGQSRPSSYCVGNGGFVPDMGLKLLQLGGRRQTVCLLRGSLLWLAPISVLLSLLRLLFGHFASNGWSMTTFPSWNLAEAKAMKLPRLWCLDSYDPTQESRNQLFLRTNSVDHQFEYDGPEEQESNCSDIPQGNQINGWYFQNFSQ